MRCKCVDICNNLFKHNFYQPSMPIKNANLYVSDFFLYVHDIDWTSACCEGHVACASRRKVVVSIDCCHYLLY